MYKNKLLEPRPGQYSLETVAELSSLGIPGEIPSPSVVVFLHTIYLMTDDSHPDKPDQKGDLLASQLVKTG